jgi:hypothetical protein
VLIENRKCTSQTDNEELPGQPIDTLDGRCRLVPARLGGALLLLVYKVDKRDLWHGILLSRNKIAFGPSIDARHICQIAHRNGDTARRLLVLLDARASRIVT